MKTIVTITIFLLTLISPLFAQDAKCDECPKAKCCAVDNSDKLVVILSSQDPLVAERVALMYGGAAKRNGWFSEVTLLLWGPSVKMVAENTTIQSRIKSMMENGISVRSCIACTESFGVTDKLKELGYEVDYMGVPLTDYLKENYRVLTF